MLSANAGTVQHPAASAQNAQIFRMRWPPVRIQDFVLGTRSRDKYTPKRLRDVAHFPGIVPVLMGSAQGVFSGSTPCPRASISANCRQFLRSAWVLLPLGHHCTLPRPIRSLPSSSSPLRTSMSRVLLLLSLVRSTEYGRNAVTLVTWTLRFRGMVRRPSAACRARRESAARPSSRRRERNPHP